MAITAVISNTTAAVVPAAGNQFTTTGPFVLYGDNFASGESAILYRLGPSTNYSVATNKDGPIRVSDSPNMVYVEAPGTYRLGKTTTTAAAYVGYEEV